MAADNDWSAVVRNLSRARAVWNGTAIILSREGVEPRVFGFFFKALVQVVLLFGSDFWVVTLHMRRALGGFQVARRLMGRLLW